MSKVIKAAAVAAAIVFTAGAITVGFAAGSMTALTFGTGLGLTATGMAVFTFVTTLVGGLIGGMGSTGGSAGSGNFGTKFAARSGIEPRQIIYGQCRVGGTYVHMSTSGVDNNLFHGVIVLAGHEIQSLEKVKINETQLTTSTSTINGETVYRVLNSKYRNTDNDNKLDSNGTLIRYTFENGSQTTANGFMTNQVSSLGANDIGKGCAFVYIQMVFDAEAFGGGIPQLSFEIKGKKVFDPRDSSTAWSDNPALCLRDYISNTEYGLKALDDEINDATTAGGFAAAANVCDQTVTLANGVSTETRYTANGFTNFSADGRNVLEVLLSSCAGRLTYSNGKFNMFAGASQTPSLTITDDDLLDSVRVVTNPASGELFNSVKPIHINKDLNFNSADGLVYEDATFLADDTPSGESSANYKKMLEVQLPFTVTGTMAQRLAKIALNSQRQTTTISVFTSLKFMRLQPTDWVYVTNDRLSFSQKTFEVISTNMETKTEGSTMILGTRLELKEIDASVFNYATSDYQDPQDEGSDVGGGDFSVSSPSSLSLTQQSNVEGATFKADVIASWTNAASDKIIGTEIAYKLSTDSDFTGDIFVGKGITSGIIPNVVVGKTYNVKVKHLDMNGVASDYTSAVNITISDGTSISAPTSFTAGSNKVGILLKWTNPSNTNLRAIKIYRKTNNNTPTNDTNLVHTMNGEPSAVSRFFQGQMDGLTAGTTYYFWLRAITHNGTHSDFTSSVNGSYSIYTNTDVGLSNVEDKSSQDIRDEIVENDLVGSGNAFSVKPNKTTFADGSTEGIFNFQLDDGTATGVNVFSSDERTKLDRLRLGQDPSNATRSIQNNDISINPSGQLAGIGTGNNSIVNNANIAASDLQGTGKAFAAGSTTKLAGVETGATVGATAGTNLKDSSDNTLGDEDVRNDDLSLAFSGTNIQIKKGTTQIGSNLDAPDALKNAEITSTDVVGPSGKLFTALPASGATVGATLGTNLNDSGGNSLGDEDVRNSDLDIDTDGTSLRIKKGTTLIQSTTLAKSNVGLSNLNSLDSTASSKLGGIAAGATVGAVAGTNLKDSSNATLDDEDVRNDDLSLAYSGTNIQIKKGTTQIGSNVDAPTALKNAEITSTDVVGPSGKLFTSLPASGATVGATVGTNLNDSGGNSLSDEDVRNDDLSLAFSGTNLQIKKGSTQIGNNLSAPNALKNDQISISASGGTVTLNNASSTNNTFNKTSVGLGNVLDAEQVKSDLSNAPNAIKNNQISLSASGGTVTLNNASSTNNTFNKTSVGLGNVLDAEQVKSDLTNAPDSIKNSEITSSDVVGPSGKLFTSLPESGATVGARVDDNLLDSNGNDLGDSDIITTQGTSNDTSNVNGRASATVKTEAQVGNNTGTNFAALVDDLNDPTSSLNITGERLTGGVIEGSLIKTDELNLKTNGTSANGVTITVNSTMSSDYIADIGTGSGMYMGGISVGGLTGSSIRGASIHLDIRAGSSSSNLYSKYFPIGIKESNQYYDTGDGYELGENTMEMEFMYFYTGTQTLKAYITADSNGSSSGLTVKCRAVKFGSEQPNAFTFTDELALTKAANNTTYETSNTITLGGFSGNLTASVSGHSSAQMSINSGSFTSSDTSVDSGDTIQLRILKPSTDATTRSATLNVGGVQDTYTIRTTGTYAPDPDDTYGCFAAGSLIWLGDGNYKPIEEVQEGDIVMTYNQEINGFEPKECTYTMTPKEDDIYKYTFFENDKELHTTDAHPLLGADHKWYALDPVKCLKEHHITAEPLTQNTELLFMDRELTSVSLKNIEMVGVQEVYNLSEVADNHNFVVDGIIAHNVGQEIKP